MRDALPAGFTASVAYSFDEAIDLFESQHHAVVVVHYHFDELRPYRLVREVRARQREWPLSVLLVRALPVELGQTNEDHIRRAYKELGADEFLSLPDEEQRNGREAALQHLRQWISSRLPQRNGSRT